MVEVLVAIAIFGAIMAGLLALTRSTLRFTSLTSAVSGSVTEVVRAEGYVSDLFRVARRVYASINVSVPADLTADTSGESTTIQCRLAGTPAGRCIGLLIPVIDPDSDSLGQPVINYDLSVLRVEQIGSRFQDEGVPRGFEGEQTLALVEYRAFNLCGTGAGAIDTCDVNDLGIDNLSESSAWAEIDAVGLLLTGISARDANDKVVPTFELPTARRLEIRFVTRADSAGGQPFTVRETELALQVFVRGLIPVE